MTFLRTNHNALLAALFMAMVFLFGGGSRYDIASLALLRPLAALALGLAIIAGPRWDKTYLWPIAAILGLAALIPALQLIPLPPEVWTKLGGRRILAEVASLADISPIWQPVSMVPWATWNALESLIVPIAFLLLLGFLGRKDLHFLALVLVALALSSCVLGLLQILGPPHGVFYTYRITNEGSAVGFFANRNHQALLLACMFPILAAIGCRPQSNLGLLVIVALGLLFLPFLLVTGSRSGLALGILGIIAGAAIFLIGNNVIKKISRMQRIIGGAVLGLAIAGLAAASVLVSRAESFNRLGEGGIAQDFRFVIWPQTYRILREFLPFGSGMGGFEDIYKMKEPAELVGPKYVNHAHNEVLELLLTGGFPAIALVVFAIAAYTFGVWRLVRNKRELPGQDLALARAAAAALFLVGLQSLVDYPLRTPIFMMIAVLFAVWMVGFGRAETERGVNNQRVNGASS